MLQALKSEEIPPVDYLASLEELPKRLRGMAQSEGLAQVAIPPWWLIKGACEKLAADALTLKLLGATLAKVPAPGGCAGAGAGVVQHAETVLRRVERMGERVTAGSRLTLSETDMAVLGGAVELTTEATRALGGAGGGSWEELGEGAARLQPPPFPLPSPRPLHVRVLPLLTPPPRAPLRA
jgi:hypothetical protein